MAVAAGTRTGAHLGRVTIYTGESIRRVGMPIGGPGTGQVSVAGDGSLRQWQISHEVNLTGFVPQTFLAIWVGAAKKEAAGLESWRQCCE